MDHDVNKRAVWGGGDKVRFNCFGDLDQECEQLLPIPEPTRAFRPRPAGSSLWWPLELPAHVALSRDELMCLLSVARRLRLDGR